MSERDKKTYWDIKSDPVRYAVYLERKRRERAAKKDYEAARKRKWRECNPEAAQRIRLAGHAVEAALKRGTLAKPRCCSYCDKPLELEAHHYKGYSPEHWLDVVWLCVFCHRKADAGST